MVPSRWFKVVESESGGGALVNHHRRSVKLRATAEEGERHQSFVASVALRLAGWRGRRRSESVGRSQACTQGTEGQRGLLLYFVLLLGVQLPEQQPRRRRPPSPAYSWTPRLAPQSLSSELLSLTYPLPLFSGCLSPFAMVQVLCEGGLGFVAMVELLVPPHSLRGSMRRSALVQPSRVVAAASLACCAVDVSLCGAPVQDATAAPPRTRDNYKLAPRTLALKTRKTRKRGSGGRSDGDGDDGGDNSDGNCGGDGSWGGGENGRGGWDSWGESWNDESRRWDEGRDALTLLYQAACWLSLSKCVHYVVVKAVGWGRDGGSASVDEAPFARCSSVFVHKEAFGMSIVDKVVC